MVLTHWMTWHIVPRKSESQPNQVLSRTCPVCAFILVFDQAVLARVHSRIMKFLQWIAARFSPRGNNVYQLINESHVCLQLQNYDKARALLLRAIGSRDHIKDMATISCILSALEATWLFTERYEDQIAFFSQYVNRYPADSAGYRGRAAALWYEGQLQNAIRDYSCALELNPSDILSLSGRARY
jgi:tetratricopeptide (TPR) repeat protein